MYSYKIYILHYFQKLGISLHILAKLNSRAGNRTPATAVKTPDPNH